MIRTGLYCSLALFALALTLPRLAQCAAKNEAVLHSFAGGSDGMLPGSGLIADTQGNLYGTTQSGGNTGLCVSSYTSCGTVFELVAPSSPLGTWNEVILYSFSGPDGAIPYAGLTFDKAGNLYGTTVEGGDIGNPHCSGFGCGTVFELSPPNLPGGEWTETVLHIFETGTDGEGPASPLIFDSAGNLYGTAQSGGSNSECINCGVAYELSPSGDGSWAETILYTFSGLADGVQPIGPIVFDNAGNIYGATHGNFPHFPATAFELSPSSQGQPWSETTLANLNYYGSGLVRGGDGNLYGSSTDFQSNSAVFQLTESNGVWTQNIVYAFNQRNGVSYPNPPILDKNLNIYLTTQESNCGGVFRLTPKSNNTWTPSQLFAFNRTKLSGGCFPVGPLTFGKWGALYGVTEQGGVGTGTGNGIVFGVLP